MDYNVRQKDIAQELGGDVKNSKMSKNEEEHYILTKNNSLYNHFIEKYAEEHIGADVDEMVTHWLQHYEPTV